MMNNENDPLEEPLDELPDGLRGIAAGIVANSAPDDLTSSVRSRLRSQLRSNAAETRAKLYWMVAGATALAAAVAAAIVLLVPAATNPAPNLDRDSKVVTMPKPRRPPAEGPSLWSYHQAANDSLDELDSLLSQHSAVMLTSNHTHTAQTDFFSTSQYLEE